MPILVHFLTTPILRTSPPPPTKILLLFRCRPTYTPWKHTAVYCHSVIMELHYLVGGQILVSGLVIWSYCWNFFGFVVTLVRDFVLNLRTNVTHPLKGSRPGTKPALCSFPWSLSNASLVDELYHLAWSIRFFEWSLEIRVSLQVSKTNICYCGSVVSTGNTSLTW